MFNVASLYTVQDTFEVANQEINLWSLPSNAQNNKIINKLLLTFDLTFC
jgi:hypothetical protein